MRTFISKDELDHVVQYVIYQHIGKANAVDRWLLVEKVFGEKPEVLTDDNPQDREIRRSKERLRHQGHLICDLGNGKGSYVANTHEEYLEFRQVYGSHAFPIMENIHAMDKAAAQKYPNPLQPGLL